MSALEAQATPSRNARGGAGRTSFLKAPAFTQVAGGQVRPDRITVVRRELLAAVYLDPGTRASKMLTEIETRLEQDLATLEEAIGLRSSGRAWFRRRFDSVIRDLRAARNELQVARSDVHGARAALRRRSLSALREVGMLCRRLDDAGALLQRAFDRIGAVSRARTGQLTGERQTAEPHPEESCGWCAFHVGPLVHQALGGSILNRLRAETALADTCRAIA